MAQRKKKYGNYKPGQSYIYGNVVLTGEQMILLEKEAKSKKPPINIRKEIQAVVVKHCDKLKAKYEKQDSA